MDLAEAKKLVIEINETVSGLDENVRAKAFEVLSGVAFDRTSDKGRTSCNQSATEENGSSDSNTGDFGDFITGFEHDKPADNVKLLAAWHFSRYGKTPVATSEIRELAREAGLTIPERPDNTLRQAKFEGKPLFQQKPDGFSPTVHGEKFFRKTYEVKRGKESKPEKEDE